MRFKSQRRASHPPQVNLTPMLDVMMTILTFFIIATMTLRTQQAVDVILPPPENVPPPPPEANLPEPMLVRLEANGVILVSGQPTDKQVLVNQMQVYLRENPKAAVVLSADPKLPYEQVVQFLGEMREIGGDRVSIAIE
ncbi:MAG: biopolymer transporter ExbD [Cyanobacteria bacterium]|nr:biopolymer transporter ExbD [Cyanobacteriota bacterium]MDW8200758.1 biopolymer transporter ExbD [Cyanobacteriota bacterium SKYGB_h_bin112]